MFLLDDILLSPLRGVIWLARKINDAAQNEIANEGEAIKSELSEIYMLLETGKITEEEFDRREKTLLDRLDEINERGGDGNKEECPAPGFPVGEIFGAK